VTAVLQHFCVTCETATGLLRTHTHALMVLVRLGYVITFNMKALLDHVVEYVVLSP